MILGVVGGGEPGAIRFPSTMVMAVDGDRLTVTISADIDCATTPGLHTRLRDLVATARARQILVDIAAVDFCDCAGVRMLAAVHRLAADRGIAFRLRRPRPHIAWLLQALDAGYLTAPTDEAV